MEWTVQQDRLQEILTFLRESQSPDNEVQQLVRNMLESLNTLPDMNNYLLYILTRLNDENVFIRSASGLILKNNVQDDIGITPSLLSLIKRECLLAIRDPSYEIRSTVANIITTLVGKEHLVTWPELLPTLTEMLNSHDDIGFNGAFHVLRYICEDIADSVFGEVPHRCLDDVICKFIQFFNHPIQFIRPYAIECVIKLIRNRQPLITTYLCIVLQSLFDLANDENVEVRKVVCGAFTKLLEMNTGRLMPHLTKIIMFMLAKTQDEDYDVKLEACEFWLYLLDEPICQDVLKPFLTQLVPLLVCNMRYANFELTSLKNELVEDEGISDRNEDVRPPILKSRPDDVIIDEGSGDSRSRESDDVYDEDMPLFGWTVRKCSAASLDVLATSYGEQLLPFIVPVLEESLSNDDWVIKESGILALGAVSSTGMVYHLNHLIPFLLNCLNHSEILVRLITCWTISRYSHWIVVQSSEVYLKPVILGLLNRILDRNKKVQKAACSAFATLEEEACAALVPYLDIIINTLINALAKYQNKNLPILYDAITTLAESVGQYLNKPEYIAAFVPPLINEWNKLDNQDRYLFPISSCLYSTVVALKSGFIPYSAPIFNRCLKMIEEALNQYAVYVNNPEINERPDKEFMIAALDLLCGLTEGLENNIEIFVSGSRLIDLVSICIQDPMPQVRHSSLALLGDLTRVCFQQVYPFVFHFLPIIIQNINPVYLTVCNNAIWTFGEIIIKLGVQIKPFVPLVQEKLIYTIELPNIPRQLRENAAITLGRLGYIAPRELAPSLSRFMHHWCSVMRCIKDGPIKESSFKGICEMIQFNPEGIIESLGLFCEAVVSWITIPDDLKAVIIKILQDFKNHFGEENWLICCQQFPPPMRERLGMMYGV